MPEPGITPADAASAGTLEAGVEVGGDQPSTEDRRARTGSSTASA